MKRDADIESSLAQAMARPQPPENPLAGLYRFVREHLSVLNGVVLASSTAVGAMDFLAPTLSFIPALVYSAAALISVAMFVAAVAPAAIGAALATVGLAPPGGLPRRLYAKPKFQIAFFLLLGFTCVGAASVAKAHDGGLIASAAPGARDLQRQLLGLSVEVHQTRAGVDAANAKLDRVVDAVDPENSADKCPDLACAVLGGASVRAIRRLISRGARVPAAAVVAGELAKGVAYSSSPDRLAILDMLLAHGLPADLAINAFSTEPESLNEAQLALAAEAVKTARLGSIPAHALASGGFAGDPKLVLWNDFARCLGAARLVELAAIRGDRALFEHMRRLGQQPRPSLGCSWPGLPGVRARVLISDGRASVAGA